MLRDANTFDDPLMGPSLQFSPIVKSKLLSPDTSLICGETEEDGTLCWEYVLLGD